MPIKLAKWMLLAAALLSVAAGIAAFRRQSHVNHLARQCAEAARTSDWGRLEELSRDWLSLRAAPVAWYWLGTSLKGQAQFGDADAAFANVPLDGIRGIDAAVERMEILFHVSQRPLEAIPLAQQLLQRDAKLASPRRHLIYFYAMTLQRPQLLREIRRAIEDRVDLPEHYVYLLTLEDLSFRDAEEVTGQWLASAPDSPYLQLIHEIQHVRTARNQARQTPSPELTQRYEEIRRNFLSSHPAESAAPVVLETLLLLAMDRGDVEEAARLLALVPDEAADDPMFWKYRGWYATRTGDVSQAEESYQRVLQLHPLAWQARHEYANLLRAKGAGSEAARLHAAAGQGTALDGESRRLPHAQKVSAPWLARLAKFAADCGDMPVANGVLRRQNTGEG